VLLGDGAWANYTTAATDGIGEGVPESARGGLGGFGAAMLGALWSYEGWAVVTCVGGEIRNPARTLPRALIGGTIVVIGLYLVVNIGYFYVLTPLEAANLPASTSIAREALSRTAGPVAVSVLACGLVISAFGTLYSSMLAGPRLPFAMARKQLLPAALGSLSKNSVPAVSVVTIGLWSALLSLTGTFDILTDICVFVGLIFYGLTGGAVFVLRKTMPDAERPYRTWGYPVVPALFVLVSFALLLNTVMVTPWRAFFGFGIVASGLPVYAFYSRRKVTSAPKAAPALIAPTAQGG
jgi:APA family basic amino acid/polyamine antiporter